MGHGDVVEVGTDASPWGLGGWMSRNGRITHYYHCAVSAHDIDILGIESGSSESQQALEALAILVALKVWIQHSKERIQLRVRGDNVGALALVVKMRPKTARLAIVARELALIFTNYSFLPAVFHTPGVSHKIADQLSRMHDPNAEKPQEILAHPALRYAVASSVPERDRSFYITLDKPSSLRRMD